MAEIIKRGVLPTEKTYTGTCRKCGTVARWKGAEVNVDSDRDGPLNSAKCPLCSDTAWGLKEHMGDDGEFHSQQWDR